MAAAKTRTEGNEGFVSSSKGITLSVVSLGVWMLTLILFRITDAIAKGSIDYQAFCLFSSFILSIATGIYISRLMYPPHDKWRALAIFLNILLIYSSANGIQTGNAALGKASSEKTNKPVSELALFGLLDTRPWLIDATSKTVIQNISAENRKLTDNNKNLSTEVAALKQLMIGNDKTGLMKNLSDTIHLLQTQNNELRAQVETLQKQPASENKDELVKQLQNEITELKNKLRQLETSANNYNMARQQWINKTNTDVKFRTFATKFRREVSIYMGKDYYNKLFNLKDQVVE